MGGRPQGAADLGNDKVVDSVKVFVDRETACGAPIVNMKGAYGPPMMRAVVIVFAEFPLLLQTAAVLLQSSLPKVVPPLR